MRGYRAILEKEMIELWRTYRLVITCGLFTALGVGLPILVRYLGGITTVPTIFRKAHFFDGGLFGERGKRWA